MRLQDLPRHLARRCLGVPRFCRESLGVGLRGTRLVVAYSTGLDSTALLHLMHLLRVPQQLTLVAAHAHHGLRAESDDEMRHAEATCARLGIPCETARLDVPAKQVDSGQGTEECARELRYAFLESVRVRHECDWILTAHHAGDLSEDILMRLIRGAGWPGLGGMPGADPHRRILRPLLDWEKDELRSFLEATDTTWRDDPSNDLSDRTRNRVRNEILPLMRRENPSFAKAALQLWELARLDADYWSRALPAPDVKTDAPFLDARALDVHPAQRLRLYKAVLDAMGAGQALARHLLLLDRAWAGRRTGSTLQFPGDKTARIESGGILFGFRKRG